MLARKKKKKGKGEGPEPDKSGKRGKERNGLHTLGRS